MTLNSEGKGIDRYVFEMSMLQPFEEGLVRPLDLDVGSDMKGKGKGRATDHDIGTDVMGGGAREYNDGNNDLDDDEPLQRCRMRLLEQEQQRRIQSTKDRPRFSGLMALTTDVEALLRAMLLKISVSRVNLPSSDSGKEKQFVFPCGLVRIIDGVKRTNSSH